MKMTESVIE